MKNTILLLTMTALLAACGASAPTDDLGKKRHELDSLKTLYKAIGEQIKATDSWIAEHDTTVKKNLPIVTTLVLTNSRFEHFVEVHGNVKADKSSELFTMGGRVRRILVSEGQQVRSGQTLIDLDNDAIAKQRDAAKAGAVLARDVFEKQSKLWEQKIGSEVQFLQAKAQMEQAEAGLAALNEQVRLSNVTAPFDGIVDDIMVTVGDMTSPMAPVARVVDPSGASLEADVPESYLQRVKTGDPVKVEFPSTGDTLSATLANVSRFINPTNRTFRVSVRVPGGSNMVRPNLLSVIHVRDLVKDSALVVPSRTIQEDVNGNNYVFVLENTDGKQRTKKVMVQRLADYKKVTMIAVADGTTNLNGATIVDEGAKSVGDGQEVKVTSL
ncbi:MAG: efflux RND transporter periplasmic adaptor subunit [Flavobacteriales bacterium]|nr:efflux RND transporter periplasmic adaptor subunit [Flavobacteriales bacterium]